MRWRICFLLLAFLAIPIIVWSASKKAKTLDELISMYDSSECESCHMAIAKECKESIHSMSIYGTGGRVAATLYTTYKALLKMPYSGVKSWKDIKVKHLKLCTKCHLPQLEDAEDSVAQELMKTIIDFMETENEEVYEKAVEKLQKLNINCLVCHQRNAIIHKWVDGYPQKDTVYGPTKTGDHFSQKYPKMKRIATMDESIFCGQCHGLGPNLELEEPSQCATLYGYYLWAYRAKGGDKTCQDCHMKESGLGHNLQSYKHPVMREMAIDFNFDARPIFWRDGRIVKPLIFAQIEIKNKAGHGIPDG